MRTLKEALTLGEISPNKARELLQSCPAVSPLWLVYAGVVMPPRRVGSPKPPVSVAFAEICDAEGLEAAHARAADAGHIMITAVQISDPKDLAMLVHPGLVAMVNHGHRPLSLDSSTLITTNA